jgi:predicted aspartyl protease
VTALEFQREFVYFGDELIIPMTLVRAPHQPSVRMVLDTGADVSLLNRQFVGPLGIDLESGTSIRLELANGDKATAWIHPVEVELLGRTMIIEVAICESWNTANLLGMRGFLDQIVLALDHRRHRLYV